MRIGQTSLIYFLSRIVASIVGFLATVYFARILGADPLGIYYLVLGLVSWLAIVGKIGVSGAVTKRVSEGEEPGKYALAGLTFVLLLFGVLAISVLVFRPYVDGYLDHPASGYLILILFVTLLWSITSSVLTGLHLVHVKGILSPVKTGGQSLLQVGAIVVGLGLTGLFLGYVMGFLFVIGVGSIFALRRLQWDTVPQWRHYESLFEYAKFAWLGNLESRMFNYTDVIVLGFFVSTGLIGVYSIAWNIAMFLNLFSGSISSTLFPEMSKIATQENKQAVSNLVEDALAFGGLILIPGLIGGLILDYRLLMIYGDEFTQGTAILSLLIAAALLRGYQKQLLNTLNAIDRPDLSFRTNALFVVANLGLNVVLIYLYGWIGAAVATTFSVAISLFVAYRYLVSIVEFSIPVSEISRQWAAALFMGIIVYLARELGEARLTWIDDYNAVFVLLLVGLGATVYFLLLFAISGQFRRTVSDNLPMEFPLITGQG